MSESFPAPETSGDRISDAEYVVMDVLWAEAPLTANMVAERLRSSKSWSLPTIKTLLSRLLAKRAIAYEPDGRRFLYSPLIARADHTASDVKRLVDRLFGGKLSPLVAHLAEQEALSPQDIAEIEALLKEIKS
ncbi:MAG: BlaI/MecI/CopY family transcriptional regulator [Pseudomonadota bacterium]